jgi:hypothetical protein
MLSVPLTEYNRQTLFEEEIVPTIVTYSLRPCLDLPMYNRGGGILSCILPIDRLSPSQISLNHAVHDDAIANTIKTSMSGSENIGQFHRVEPFGILHADLVLIASIHAPRTQQ